ncbi:MAG: InlB B-repeat-containing protein [Defluviitaleaceae bacterium]|nr:InlB B-repeat-containing protein [Defluviitaleaceae bacterium]
MKKKFLSLLLAFCMLFGLTAGIHSSAAEGGANLLPYGNFAGGMPSQWTKQGSSGDMFISTDPDQGNVFVMVFPGGNYSRGYFNGGAELVVGAQYRLSVTYKANSMISNARIGIIYNAAESTLSGNIQLLPSAAWRTDSYEFTLAEANWQIWIQTSGTDARVEVAEIFLEALDPSVTPTPIQPPAQNLLPNGDFSDGLANWNHSGGIYSITSDFAADYGDVLHLPRDSGGTVVIRNSAATGSLEAGKQYELTVIYYNAGALTDPTDRTFVGINAANTDDVGNSLAYIYMSQTGRWIKNSVLFVMPESYNWQLLVRAQTAAPDIYIAGIYLNESDAPLPTPTPTPVPLPTQIPMPTPIPIEGVNIFNGGKSLIADTWGKWGQWGAGNNGVVTNSAVRWSGGLFTACYPLLTLEPNTTYTVRVLARAEEAGSPAENTDEANKICFQYRSDSEEEAGASAWDKFNLYVTDSDWTWYEGSFTTPSDMYSPLNTSFCAITIRNGFSGIEVEEMHIVNDAGENVFNGGNEIMADSVNLWGQWGAGNIGIVTNPAVYYSADYVHTATYTELTLQPNMEYDVKVLARSGVAGSPENLGDSNKVCFQFRSASFEEEFPEMGGWDKLNFYITSDKWEWYEATLVTPDDMTGTFGSYSSITIQNSFSDLYIEQILVVEKGSTIVEPLKPMPNNRLTNGNFADVGSDGRPGLFTTWSDDPSGGVPTPYFVDINADPVFGNVLTMTPGFKRVIRSHSSDAIMEYDKVYMLSVVYRTEPGYNGNATVSFGYEWGATITNTIPLLATEEWVRESILIRREQGYGNNWFLDIQKNAGYIYIAEISITEFVGALPTQITVGFDYNGGSGYTESVTVNQGANVTLPSASRAGYSFLGWYTAAGLAGTFVGRANDAYVAVYNATLVAQWVEQVPKWPADAQLTVGFNPYGAVNWETFDSYKANFHTHTNNSDGAHTVAQMLEDFYAKGYNIATITDHNVVAPSWDTTVNPVGRLTTQRKLEMEAGVGRTDGKGMIGLPFTNEPSSVDHALSFFVNYNQPYFPGTTLERLYKTLRDIEDLGGISHINHPGRETGAPWGIIGGWGVESGINISKDPAVVKKYVDIFNAFPSCFGMEIINKLDNESAGDRILWDSILSQTMSYENPRPVFGVSNDDAHDMSASGYSFNMMFLPELTAEAVRTSMETGAFYAVSRVSHIDRINHRVNGNTTPGAGNSSTAFMLAQSTPSVASVKVEGSVITIVGADYDLIEWISEHDVIATGESIDVSEYAAVIGHYVRAVLKSSTGIAFLQPFGIVLDDEIVTPPPTLASASATAKDFVSIKETAKNSNVWVLSFNVTEKYSDGTVKIVPYAVEIKANNANIDGKLNLGPYTLVYDIKGNGSNIKEFKILMN